MDYLTLASYLILGGVGVIALREIRLFAVSRVRAKAQIAKVGTNAKFEGLSALVANAEEIRGQLINMRDEMLAKGAKPENLAPIDNRIKWMDRIVDNRSWLEYVAPHLDGLIGSAIKKGMKVIEKL